MLTQSKLKQRLHYVPETGIFTRRVMSSHNARIGDIAGTVINGYMRISVLSKLYYSHRLAFLYMTGKFPRFETDHINHIKSDNRWANLRRVTSLSNNRNRSKSPNNTSGVIGVHWCNTAKRWVARIKIMRKRH